MSPGRLYSVEAIIIKRKNVGEADRHLTLFTKEFGKIRCIAKGVRKIQSRRAGHIEIFSHVRAMIRRGKTMDQLTEVTPEVAFSGIRVNLRKVNAAYYICELADTLLPDHLQHPDIFHLLARTLAELNKSEEIHFLRMTEIFALCLLGRLGYLPEDSSRIDAVDDYIERIIEKRLKTPRLLTKLLA
ncbi:MAG: repair protein RecO protein [Microgenomates group bacterium GW2011_GWA2_47_8]|nr:MAG: repair protein RecO protein [Microgenomates group bacterium GW2011_GWA2_47_8]